MNEIPYTYLLCKVRIPLMYLTDDDTYGDGAYYGYGAIPLWEGYAYYESFD